jgi:hypothetical protein
VRPKDRISPNVKTSPPAAPIKKTAATFSKNAFKAFKPMIVKPIFGNAKNGAQPSVKGTKHALMMAQIGA